MPKRPSARIYGITYTHVFAALRAGARGYLVKGADGEEITQAVLSVADGDAVYGGR